MGIERGQQGLTGTDQAGPAFLAPGDSSIEVLGKLEVTL